MPKLRQLDWNGRQNWKRQLVYARLFRNRTKCSKSRLSARTHFWYHLCSLELPLHHGVMRTHSQGKSHVLCRFVSATLHGLATFTYKECSIATADGRALVAIGCAEGVWIGFRHDSRCECIGNPCGKSVFINRVISNATRAALENGNSVCYARGLRHFPRTGG